MTTNVSVINQEVPNKIAALSPTAKAIFQLWSGREKFRRKNNLTHLRRQLIEKLDDKFSPEDFMVAIQQLEKELNGSVIHGRNGSPDYLMINYSLKDLGAAVMSPKTAGPIIPLEEKKAAPKTKQKAKKASGKKRGRPVGWRKNQVAAAVTSGRIIVFPPGHDKPLEFASVDEAKQLVEYIKGVVERLSA